MGEIPDDLGAGSSGRQYAGAAGVWWSWGSGSRQNFLAQLGGLKLKDLAVYGQQIPYSSRLFLCCYETVQVQI